MLPSHRDALVLGTAGHIDHGKTALIRALTGVDTDRLPEEKRRGITIELGFAPLDLPSGRRLGVVDVPGHEGLVRTMVAGASGIDLVLLVIAADEGVMPQTREHLAICDLLGLSRGVVALTKVDRAEPDVAELAEAEVRELLAGTSLGGAPVLPVSSVTGQGLDALRDALDEAASEAAPRTAREGPARLWVDRAFEMRGFGAVATGTLVGAPLRTGDAVELHPAGRTARVRGLQSFGRKAKQVTPGARCAVNLHGVELGELSRGMQIASAGALEPTGSFDAALAWLPEAPAFGSDPGSVELLVGTARFRARVAPIGVDRLRPGAAAFARVHLSEARAALLPGDRFVLRGFARLAGGGATLGGGQVLDVAPPHRRRSDPALLAELEALRDGGVEAALRVRVARAGFAGATPEELRRRTGLSMESLLAAAEAGEAAGRLLVTGDRLVTREHLEALERRALEALGAFHEREPMRPGMPLGALRGALPANAERAVVERALGRLAERGALESHGDLVCAADFAPRLTQRQEALAARLRADAMIAGLEPPTLRDWSAEVGADPGELRDVLAHLEREGSLVRAPGELWFDRVAVDELRERVVAWLEEHGELETPAYKELIGTTRKYAVPLMELFDAEHLTVRSGEARKLRRRPGGPA